MWFNKRKRRQEEILNEEKQRKTVNIVSDMVLLLEKKLAMACVEIDAIKLRFKKKIPYDKEPEQLEPETEKPKDTYSGMFIPENDGGKGIKQGL